MKIAVEVVRYQAMSEKFTGIWTVFAYLVSIISVTGAALDTGLERVFQPSLNVPSIPQLYDYHSVKTFPNVRFNRPVRLTAPPGETERLFVVEQSGQIWLIDDFDNPVRKLFLNLSVETIAREESGLLNLAFHPDYASNGYFFIFYTLNSESAQGVGLHDRLSRFTVSADNPNRADPNSEVVLIDQYDRSI